MNGIFIALLTDNDIIYPPKINLIVKSDQGSDMEIGNHDSRAVANRLIKMGMKERKYFTPLQIMKLVYYCHAWMLGANDKKLLSHKIVAWKYGPVISELYGETRQYGRSKIKKPLGYKEFNFEFDEEFSKEEEELIDQVFKAYSTRSGIELSSMTHEVGTPWHSTWHMNNDINSEIPDTLIKAHYAKKFSEYSEEREPS